MKGNHSPSGELARQSNLTMVVKDLNEAVERLLASASLDPDEKIGPMIADTANPTVNSLLNLQEVLRVCTAQINTAANHFAYLRELIEG